jgi:hypothetical protein
MSYEFDLLGKLQLQVSTKCELSQGTRELMIQQACNCKLLTRCELADVMNKLIVQFSKLATAKF